MSNPSRRKGGRGSDYSRRDQNNWGSPRSGSPGSPGINGSPRTGRRDQRDRRGDVHVADHDNYVEYLKRRWAYVQKQDPDIVTYYKDPEYNPVEPVPPTFDVERFFIERQQQQRQMQQLASSHPQLHNSSGMPS